jgi:hypothetical protein
MILTGVDWEVGYVTLIRNAGWTRPILEYIDSPFAMGPSGAASGSCSSGYAGWSNSWTSGLNEFCAFVHPNESWFLHNGAGRRIYRSAGTSGNFYLMNPASAGWRGYVQGKIGRLWGDYHLDGLFLDDVWATAIRPRSRETNSDGICQECGTDAQWHASVTGFVQAAKATAGARPVWINSDDSAGYVASVNGYMLENMCASWGTAFMPQSEVLERWADIDVNVAAGKDVILVGQGNARTDVGRMRYSHACYLMVAGPRVSYRFQNAGDYRAFWDYPEFSYELGAPSGGRFSVGVSGWRRNFTAGTAIVNISASTSQAFALGGSYLTPDGATVTSVTLGPRQGMALRSP